MPGMGNNEPSNRRRIFYLEHGALGNRGTLEYCNTAYDFFGVKEKRLYILPYISYRLRLYILRLYILPPIYPTDYADLYILPTTRITM